MLNQRAELSKELPIKYSSNHARNISFGKSNLQAIQHNKVSLLMILHHLPPPPLNLPPLQLTRHPALL
jgi:hypothetical protein